MRGPTGFVRFVGLVGFALLCAMVLGACSDGSGDSGGGGRGEGMSQQPMATGGGSGSASGSGEPVGGGSGSEPNHSLLRGWTDRCEGEGPVPLTHSPLDPEVVVAVVPLGSLAGAHVTPIDHLYLYPSWDQTAPDAFPVYMMADGYIKEISRRVHGQGSPDEREEFRLVFQHSCTFFSYFDLVRVLAPDVAEAFRELQRSDHASGHYFVPAGQEVARIGGQSLDTAVYNTQKPLTGFISPELYEGEFWKIYTDDFFEYLPVEVSEALLAKSPRTAPPLSGKIDHDVPGRLIGNWFEEGTNGYAGRPVEHEEGADQFSGRGYWSGHLAFVPDVFQPEQLKLSIGDYDGEARQFSVRDNGPDFAEVGVDSGVVRYELIEQKVFNSDDPIQMARNEANGPVLGVVLVQVLEGERLMFEVFPGTDGAEVDGFTEAVKVFER